MIANGHASTIDRNTVPAADAMDMDTRAFTLDEMVRDSSHVDFCQIQNSSTFVVTDPSVFPIRRGNWSQWTM